MPPKPISKFDSMRVEKLKHPSLERVTFRVYFDGLPVRHVNKFLSHLDKRDFAPNTVNAYAHDLAQYFRYLTKRNADWRAVDIDTIIDFIAFHKHSKADNLSILPTELGQARSLVTINRCLASIGSYYRYCVNMGLIAPTSPIESISNQVAHNPKIKEFLSFATASRPLSVSRELKPFRRVQVPKKKVKTISEDLQLQLIEFCSNSRDRLLIMLLLETGMRIGQALQLRHSDIESWDSKLHIHRRLDNANEVYAKTRHSYEITISEKWTHMYTDYLLNEVDDVDSDYVFTKLYRKDGGNRGEPLNYASVKDLFSKFSKHVSAHITPHMLRHTFATEQLRAKTPIEIVSKALGHASIDTTKSIYEHLTAEDIKHFIFKDKKGV